MRRWYVWAPISLGLLALLAWRTRPWDAAALASQLDLGALGLALALNLVVVLVWAERSRSLMAAVGSPLSRTRLVPIVSFANTVNNLTPASSGEVFRAMILHRQFAVPYSNAAAVILAERLWAFGMILVTACAAAIGTIVSAPTAVVAIAWIVGLVACFAPSIAYSLGFRPGRLAAGYARSGGEHPGRLRKLAQQLAVVDERLAVILTNRWRATHFVATTGLLFTLFAAQLWLVLNALDTPVPLIGVWGAYGLAICAGVIAALPFGLGATDVVLVILLGAQGVDVSTAGAAVLLLRIVATLPLGILGTGSWIWLQRGGNSAVAAESYEDARRSEGAGP